VGGRNKGKICPLPSREIVRNGENGILVRVRDAKALAVAIRRLIEDPLLRKRMEGRGRDIAVAKFSLDEVISETLGLS
jgi:glycosyltransferase involved in cell wall biosynthesis